MQASGGEDDLAGQPAGIVRGDEHHDLGDGPRWVDGSYLLFVEPRLIGKLDVVSVRVADVCREVVGTPFGPKARFLD
jgi:hypothetical protein